LQTEGFNIISIIGVGLWLIGFIFELIADQQLTGFLRNKDKPQKVMDGGLWRYSRHPNYFGEVTTWWGIGILVASTTDTWWLPLLGPVVITYLIVFVSGIPPLERRHRHNPSYAEYNRRTSVFIPLPPRR
jgi:steroid 5-alpha reductase family enzyme